MSISRLLFFVHKSNIGASLNLSKKKLGWQNKQAYKIFKCMPNDLLLMPIKGVLSFDRS